MSRQKYVVVGRVLLVAVAAVMLSGCFGFLKPSLTITIDPDPIEFTFADLTEEKDINIKFTTKGIGLIKIEQIVFELFEPDDDENPITSNEVEVDITIPVVPGLSEDHDDTFTLPEDLLYDNEDLYNQELKGKTYTLKITISGNMDPIVKEVDVKFN
ncbi:MAG: hypothetical protein WBK74_05740 [Limnochordia bacterium]